MMPKISPKIPLEDFLFRPPERIFKVWELCTYHLLLDVIIHCMSSGQVHVNWSSFICHVEICSSFRKDIFWYLLACRLTRLEKRDILPLESKGKCAILPLDLKENARFFVGILYIRDLSRRTELIAVCRGEWKKSQFRTCYNLLFS